MRILIVAGRFPFPPLKGDQVVLSNRLRGLAAIAEIHLVVVSRQPVAREHYESAARYCTSIHLLPLRLADIVTGMIFGLLRGLPAQASLYAAPRLERKVRQIVGKTAPTAIHLVLCRLFPLIRKVRLPVVAELIDSLSMNFTRQATTKTFPLSLLYRGEARLLHRLEKAIGERATSSIFVSEADARYCGIQAAVIAPNGVDLQTFRPGSVPPAGREFDMVFSANFGYSANRDALVWFAAEVWPRIKKARPTASVLLAGVGSDTMAKRVGASDVAGTGYVPALRDALVRARFAIAPMVNGSGMQNKICEALACGLPVVATEKAVEAFRKFDSIHAVIREADDPEAFAQACIDMIRSARATQLGAQAREFAEERLGWDASNQAITAIYEGLRAPDD